ncbi:unnamed protein product [Cochlearia groenlandica]
MPFVKESDEPKKEDEDEEEEDDEEEDSYVWDNDTQLYFHYSSGFYHDPNAGWYYCSKDGHYYKHENGVYVPLEQQHDEFGVNRAVDTVTCDASEAGSGNKVTSGRNENRSPVSLSNRVETPSGKIFTLEDTLIEVYLAGNNQRHGHSGDDNQDYQMLPANDDDDEEELEEGEWIPEEDFDPQEDNFDEAAPSTEEEIWLAQYGQVTESSEKTVPEISSVDLWDWKLVCESRESDNEHVARLVGRLVRRSANLHPSVASGGKLFKTAPICEARGHLVRVRTGQVYRVRNPSPKYLSSLPIYNASDPTKDWGFPEISTTWQNPDTKRKEKKVKQKTNRKKLTVKPQDEINMIEEQGSSSYRDRAAERRNLHGGYGVGPGQKGAMTGLDADEHDTTVSEEDATAEALEFSFGSGSYARKIMGNMGWKEGERLGKNTKGLVEPIQAVGNTGNVGLGYPQRRRK